MLVLPRQRYDDVIEQALDGGTEEICGILGGTFDDDRSIVSTIEPAGNVAETPRTRYYIDPSEQLDIIERIEAGGEEVVGFYHSHPAGPPGPSVTDADRATWPGRSYVIVALDGHPFVGSWRWRGDEGFQPEPILLRAG